MNKSVSIIGTRGYPSYYGGFETAVRKLAPFLVDQGWTVTVYGRRGATSDDDSDRDLRVHTIVTPGFESKSFSTLSYGLSAVVHAMLHPPSVALVMNVANGFWIPLLRMRGIPVVVNVDGIEWDRAKWGRLAKAVFKLGARFTAHFGTILISDAHEIRRRWLEEFRRDSTYVPYGGDLTEGLPVEQGLQHRQYVLLVARFVPENSVGEFFDAVEQIAEKHTVILVGSSGYGGPLDERAHDLDLRLSNVTWLGHVRNDKRLLALWEHSGVYFHGHSVGGTNPSLVQAMACGAPIVALDTPYNREVLQGSGHFTTRKADDIASQVLSVLGDSVVQESMSLSGRRRAASHYSWEAVLSAYEAAMKQLLTKSETDSKHATKVIDAGVPES